MKFWKKHQQSVLSVQTAPRDILPLSAGLPHREEMRLYDSLRDNVPIIDAAITKIIRLVGGYQVSCSVPAAERALARFLQTVPVGGGSTGADAFLSCYLDNLLTYGNAIGEILLSRDGRVAGLYNGSLLDVDIRKDPSSVLGRIISLRENGLPLRENGRILFTALNPPAGEVTGTSLLKGLPFVADVLLKIFRSTGANFERVGNVRYAVTYKPADSLDKAYAKDRAAQIAREWSRGMNDAKNGVISDFVCVGDVGIKVIGADNQILETEVPVRQLLEQIVAKLGVPPFLLGLSWSTTERMSKQQADILTSELACYRRLLTPVILRICEVFLRTAGYGCEPKIAWSIINLQDENEMATARLNNAQAERIEAELRG